MSKLPWLRLRKKTAPELPYEPPIFLGDKSNGEFYHRQTPLERQVRDEIRRRCDDNARKLAMDRREFIARATALGATTDRRGLAAMDLTAVLTRVVQEQTRLITEQRARIARLEEELGIDAP